MRERTRSQGKKLDNRKGENEEKEERVNKIIHIMGNYIHAEAEVSSFSFRKIISLSVIRDNKE